MVDGDRTGGDGCRTVASTETEPAMETADRAFGFSRGDAAVRLGLDGAERRREEGDGRREMVGGLLRTEGEEEWRSAVAANGWGSVAALGGRRKEKEKRKKRSLGVAVAGLRWRLLGCVGGCWAANGEKGKGARGGRRREKRKEKEKKKKKEKKRIYIIKNFLFLFFLFKLNKNI